MFEEDFRPRNFEPPSKKQVNSAPPEGEGYAVVQLNQHNKQFAVWHATLEEARHEAERLASVNNQAFAVIKLVGIAEPAARPVNWKLVPSELNNL